MKDYFPLRLATGNRFCNRQQEQAELKRNVELARHTVLVSPRRYGKSSLVHKIIKDMKIPAAYIDFFMAHDDKTITLRVLTGIASVLSQIMPLTQKTISTLEKYFTRLKLALTVKGIGFSLSYNNEREFDAAAQIHEALKGLAAVAKKQNKKVVIFIDEFQDIINAENSQSIQGALRNIAQEHNEIIFIFSGSSRRLLLDIFDDSKKPFYMLCDKMILNRMTSDHYYPYIQKAIVEKWGNELSEASYHQIIQLTELHPFYINLLGNQLIKNNKLPTEEDVLQAWRDCLDFEKRRLITETEYLTLNQQKVLKFLAFNPTSEPMGQAVLNTINLSSSSMSLCIKFLLERDLAFEVDFEDKRLPLFKKGQYRVLDPLLSFLLKQQV